MSGYFATEIVCNCVIIRAATEAGTVSETALPAAKRLVGVGAVESRALARVWSASHVVGLPRDITALRNHHLTEARRRRQRVAILEPHLPTLEAA